MPPTTRPAPIWLMGLGNLPFGFFSGILVVTAPQILAAQHVPGGRIASIMAVVISAPLWIFWISPILDVRFSRRWYATAFAALAALTFALALLLQTHIDLLQWLLFLGFGSISLSSYALGGWLATLVRHEDEGKLSAWNQGCSFGGGGLMAILTEELLRVMPLRPAALLLGVIVLLPTLIYLRMPAPGPDRKLARESFGGFFRAILQVIVRRETLIALALFLLPSASFSLTNILGGLGNDFHATPRIVAAVGGFGVSFAGILGCTLFVPLSRIAPLRPIYLGIGIVGSLFTAGLLLLPHSTLTFCIAMIGENIFQSMAFSAAIAIAFETIGRDNPLSATQFSLFVVASIVPLVYMEVLDGHGYASHGLPGAFLTDAVCGLTACLLLTVILYRFTKPRPSASLEAA
jgi:PAT family beta-lactamase induction signal transducer AmpG